MAWQLHTGSGAPGTIAGQTNGDNYVDDVTGALFDSTSFDATSYNRGWIVIEYVD
jgi:hypothetical protein